MVKGTKQSKVGTLLCGYLIRSHSVCNLLITCGFIADHNDNSIQSLLEHETIVWTDLELNSLGYLRICKDDYNDVFFHRIGDYLYADVVPILRIDKEESLALEKIEADIYDNILKELARSRRHATLTCAYAAIVTVLVTYKEIQRWIKSH